MMTTAMRAYFRRTFATVALAACALASLPSAASAAQTRQANAVQPAAVQPIRVGQSVSSRLDPDQGRPYEDYRLTLAENATVRIEMVSPAGARGQRAAEQGGFDTYLEIHSPDGRSLASNDDASDNSLNSRLIFTAPTAGDYIIRASALGEMVGPGEEPSYVLTVARLEAAPDPVPLASSNVQASLGETSPLTDFLGTSYRFAVYSFEGEAFDRIQLTLTSDASHHAMQVVDSSGAILAANLGGSAVDVVTVLPARGRYLIRVLVNAEGPISYSLTSARVPHRPRAPTVMLNGQGQVVEDSLTLESNVSPKPDGSGEADFFYRLFRMRVIKDRPVTVTLSATGFEPVLEAGERETLGFVGSMLARAAPDRGARLVLQPFRTGTIFIRVRSSGMALGSWRLDVIPGVAPAP